MREREWELYDFHYDNVPKVDSNELSIFLFQFVSFKDDYT